MKDFKLEVVKEAIETGKEIAVANRYELSSKQLQHWVNEFEKGKYATRSLEDISPLESKILTKSNRLFETDLKYAYIVGKIDFPLSNLYRFVPLYSTKNIHYERSY